MKQTLQTKSLITALLLFVFSFTATAQLVATVTPLDALCAGTGSLNLGVTGNDPAGVITFTVYSGANTSGSLVGSVTTTVPYTPPYFLSSLNAGTYTVVATQVVGGVTTTSPAVTRVIANSSESATYNTTIRGTRCGPDGAVTINTERGAPLRYELYSTFPIPAGATPIATSTTNVFTGLATGLYGVRVYDACGQFADVTVRIQPETTNVTVSAVQWPVNHISLTLGEDWHLDACDRISPQHRIYTNRVQEIFYPLTITYIITDPDGNVMPQRFTQTIASGDPYDQYFRAGPIPFFECEAYSYDMEVRDACNNMFPSRNNRLEECYDVVGSVSYGHCDESITYSPINYVLPYTTVITYVPPVVLPGETPPNPPLVFIPEDHSDEFPLFNGPAATFNQHVPNGTYTAIVTDACGNAVTVPNTIVDLKPIDLILSGIIPCGATQGVITGAFTNAPTNFVHVNIVPPFPEGFTGPTNLDSGINPLDPSAFAFGPLPVGVYHIEAEHECEGTLPAIVVFEPSTAANPIFSEVRPGCEVGMSSINIYSNENRSGVITGVWIVEGPEQWRINNPDPVDVSSNLIEGQFFMNSLPEGEYKFRIIDDCGEREFTYNLEGYEFAEKSADILTDDCASFGITIDVQGANNTTVATYWLQKKNAQGQWSSPLNPANVYVEGATPLGNYFDVDPSLQPANGNSLRLRAPGLANGVYTPGFGTGSGSGDFRVIEVFSIFGNGVDTGARCVTVLAEATLGVPPVIVGAFSFPCTNGGGEIVVSASVNGNSEGLIYRVDGGPEQTSNVFTGLVENQSYTFYVTDANRCNTVNIVGQIQPAPELDITQNGACENQLVTLSLPDFNFLDYAWFRTDNADDILSTDATLSFPSYTSSINAGEYQVRITNPTNPDSCLNQTLTYTLGANALPNAGVDSLNNTACTDATAAPIDLNTLLTAPFDATGVWTDVATGAVVTGGSFNIAAVTADSVFNFAYTVTDSCGNTDVASVRFTINETPALPVITGSALVCEGAAINFVASSTTPNVTYSWTTPRGTVTGSTINIATSLLSDAGDYTVTATSANGVCVSAPVTVTLTVTALVTAGDDITVPATCSDLATNEIDLFELLSTTATQGGTFSVGSNPAPGPSFDGANTFDTAGLVGTYDFIYSVTACGITDTATITFTINPTPAAPVATVANAVVCENGTIQLNTPTFAGTGAVTYAWSGPNGFTSALQNPTVPATIAAAGNYQVIIIVDNCTSAPSAPVAVTVTPLPQFSLAGNTVICPTQSTTLSVVPTNFTVGDANITYSWTFNGAPISAAATATVSELGSYVVTITNTVGGCASPAQTITVTADPDPFAIVLAGDCVNERFIMSITNIEDIGTTQSIVWSGPGLAETSGNNPTIDLTEKAIGTYQVTVTNADGCFKTQTIDVTSTSCMIPRGISPDNADSKNDFFDLTNLGVQNLQIFNRYGLQVYEKNNYTKEWFGQSDKGDLPTGTYFYVAKMADKQVTGWVYIQRNSN